MQVVWQYVTVTCITHNCGLQVESERCSRFFETSGVEKVNLNVCAMMHLLIGQLLQVESYLSTSAFRVRGTVSGSGERAKRLCMLTLIKSALLCLTLRCSSASKDCFHTNPFFFNFHIQFSPDSVFK